LFCGKASKMAGETEVEILASPNIQYKARMRSHPALRSEVQALIVEQAALIGLGVGTPRP
jgi:hypothetical protein